MNKTTRVIGISLIANTFLSIIKIIFGIIGNTKSLVADGFHSFSDLVTDIVGIVGSNLAEAKEDKEHPYGHGKIEYIASLIISISIITIGSIIFVNAFDKSDKIPNFYTSIVVIITIIIKFMVSNYLLIKGKELNSNILISSSKESLTDVLTSVLVLIVVILSVFYEQIPVFRYADMVGSIIISLIVIKTGITLLFENLSLLIDSIEDDPEKIKMVSDIIKSHSEVSLKSLELLKFGSYYKAIITIRVDGDITISEGHKIMDEIEEDLLGKDTNVKYITIHIEPNEGSSKNARITRSRNRKRNFKKKSFKQRDK